MNIRRIAKAVQDVFLHDQSVGADQIRKNAQKNAESFYRKNSELQISNSEIPPSTKFVSNRQERENVLFLTLSTMNSPKMYKYEGSNSEGSAKFIGISQLEAGTKNILYQLALNREKLSRIVIVESEDTRTKEVAGIAEDFWDDPEYMEDKIKSAVCFYKQRILDYIRRNYSKKILVKSEQMIAGYEKFETHFPDDVVYSEEELGALFYDIPTVKEKADEKGGYKEESLELFMEIIHGIKGNEEKAIHLYVDTQGGARGAIQQINAVLELLKNQNVNIMGRYAIPDFNYNDPVYRIKEVGDSYKAYELVSAMTEFKQYGRGEGLEAFLGQREDELTRAVINVIKKISGAIAICNIVEFENALGKMRALKTTMGENAVSIDSEIRIVFQDIVDNYDCLLKENRTQFDIIKWCVDHYYYQQAITIIESRMPKMLVECGLLYYNEEDHPVCEDGSYKSITIKKLCQEICEQSKVKWKSAENYLFEQWLYSNKDKRSAAKYFGSSIDLTGNLVKEWKNRYGGFSSCKDLECKQKKKGDTKEYKFKYEPYDQYVDGNKREHKIFRMFAALSQMLKLARNEINHANSHLSEMQIRDALDAYIQMGEELKLNEKWREKKCF